MKLFLCISALSWQMPYFNLISSEKWLWNGWTPLELLGEGISREYFPKGSLLLNNHRCCMRKKLKALPDIFCKALTFCSLSVPPATASQCRSFVFSSCPSKARFSCPAPSLQPGPAWLWLSVLSWDTLLLPSAHHRRELGRRGVPWQTPCTAQGNVPWKGRTPHFPISQKPVRELLICSGLEPLLPHHDSWWLCSAWSQCVSHSVPLPSCSGQVLLLGGVWGRHTAILEWLQPWSDAPRHCWYRSTCWTLTPLLTHISLCTDCSTSGSSLTHLQKEKLTCFTGMWGGSCNYRIVEHIKMRISLFLQDFAYIINNLNCQL